VLAKDNGVAYNRSLGIVLSRDGGPTTPMSDWIMDIIVLSRDGVSDFG